MTTGRLVHVPVLVDQVVAHFNGIAGIVVDATVGLGGHAAAILEALPRVSLVGVDRDREALRLAGARLARFGSRVRLLHARFSELTEALVGVDSVGLVADLGVSSLQLDEPSRGFSFRAEAHLDMRMDQHGRGEGAGALLARLSVEDLTLLLRENGLGDLARRVARAIVAARPITSTSELAAVVEQATPAARRGSLHPATKVFQALRILTNDEMSELDALCEAALQIIAPGGVCQVIAYHSGEDRVVKRFMGFLERGGCRCDPRLGCVCGARPLGKRLVRHAITPSAAEVAANPRARSARLRVAQILRRDPRDALPRLRAEVASWHG